MSQEPVQEALSRFSQALDRLEAASLRHQEGERLRIALESELALMRADRQSLAEALDQSVARGRQLEEQFQLIDQRIERAIASVRDCLNADG
ncbi:MAG TPA: DUF4164 family protein [Beijerinckiaceae bacterium]|nr:DUF4164 family protein [Beijerinckiaceae bacterium]